MIGEGLNYIHWWVLQLDLSKRTLREKAFSDAPVEECSKDRVIVMNSAVTGSLSAGFRTVAGKPSPVALSSSIRQEFPDVPFNNQTDIIRPFLLFGIPKTTPKIAFVILSCSGTLTVGMLG